jgi:hypothetical protein
MGDFAAIFYPSLIICGFFTLILVVGIVFSYIWLNVVHKRLTSCPQCQKQGGGELVETQVVSSQAHMNYQRTPPERITETTHEDRYKCRFCGHEWHHTFKQTERAQIKVN